MGARCVGSTLALVAGTFILAFAGSTASAAASCAYPAAIGGTFTCLHVGAKCQIRNAKAYKAAALVCARTRRGRRLKAASLSVQRQGRALALGSSGRPTYQQALWDFSHTIGGLPGVHVPAGAVGRQADGTSALKAVLGFESRLSGKQRAAVNAVLNAPGPVVATADPSNPAAPAVPSAAAGIQADLTEAISRLRAHGVKLVHPIQIKALSTNDGTEEAHTVATWLYKGHSCVISFRPSGLNAPQADRRVILLHELMHCASGELVTTAKAWEAQPKFLDEGLPEWAAYQIGIEWQGSIGKDDWWSDWLDTSQLPLFGREYDAVGFWALIKHEGADPFSLFPSLVAAGSSGSPQAVYQVASNSVGGDVLAGDWGPTLGGHADFGARWNLDGPGEPARKEPDKGTIDNGTPPAVAATPKGGATEFKVDVEAEIVLVQGPKTGSGYFRDSAATDHILTGDIQRFCTEDTGCFCPDGSELDYPMIPKGDSYIGFATDQGAGSAGIIGESTDNDVGCKGKGKQGIKVLGQDSAILAVFSQGTCSLKGGTFKAHATDSGYTLDVKVSGASYGHTYDLTWGSSDPTFTIKGPGGPFSNSNGFPGQPPPNGGGVGLAKKGQAMTLGFIEAFNPSQQDGVAVAGYMVCKSPKKK